MARISVPEGVPPPTPRDVLAERIEEELDRLRRARPNLASRLDRASQIQLMQLSVPARQRPIRCRLDSGGRHRRALVTSSSGDGVYVVTASPSSDWSCSCPDHHRHGPGCKHALSVYILSRVTTRGHARPRSELGCAHCHNGWISLGEDVIDAQTGEVVHAENVVRCKRCRPPEPPLLSASELEAWMRDQRWIYAKTMPKHPHEYTLKRNQDPSRFEAVVSTIWKEGWNRRYLGRDWRTMHIGEHICWIHTRPSEAAAMPLAQLLEITILLNRTRTDQPLLVDMHRAE